MSGSSSGYEHQHFIESEVRRAALEAIADDHGLGVDEVRIIARRALTVTHRRTQEVFALDGRRLPMPLPDPVLTVAGMDVKDKAEAIRRVIGK